ncbi:hypothetical protein Mapa_005838 [Marchantia paleacea]|nr:hypothetical protein Mapa_005838 [Marchantia paleacea]
MDMSSFKCSTSCRILAPISGSGMIRRSGWALGFQPCLLGHEFSLPSMTLATLSQNTGVLIFRIVAESLMQA